jgi:hypothetical protein
MITLIISKKYNVLIDDEDLDKIQKFKWSIYLLRKTKPYVRMVKTKNNKKGIYLHRFLLNLDNPKVQVDHINGNSLDNRRCNLRICKNPGQNAINRPKQKNNNSGYKGVFLRKDKDYINKNIYRAAIRVNQKLIHLGNFTDKKEAAKAYNKAAMQYFGEFAYLNEIEK